MKKINFIDREDQIKGYYLLATKGIVRSLPNNTYEIQEQALKMIDDEGIEYRIINNDEEIDETQTLRNSLTPGI